MRTKFSLLALLLVAANPAQGRVFDFKKEKIASYFHLTGGPSTLLQSPFGKSGGTDLSYSDQYNYNYSGEFGALLALGGMLNVRLGIAFLRPNQVAQAEAKNGAGVTLYKLNSTVVGAGGVMNLELVTSGGPTSRVFLLVGGGAAKFTLKNEYQFTTDGAALYGKPDYIEEGGANSYFGQAGFGFEGVLSDNVTIAIDAGYRYLMVSGMKHERDHDGINGVVGVGTTMKDNDGTDRNLNLSGAYVGIGFRFYISLL